MKKLKARNLKQLSAEMLIVTNHLRDEKPIGKKAMICMYQLEHAAQLLLNNCRVSLPRGKS